MRVLIAGRKAKLLAAIAGTVANDLWIETSDSRAGCLALLAGRPFDLVLACETLTDGSGLDVLRHVAVHTPSTLRIFAARPSTLTALHGELELLRVLRTLPYPVNLWKVAAGVKLARTALGEESRERAPVVLPPRSVQDPPHRLKPLVDLHGPRGQELLVEVHEPRDRVRLVERRAPRLDGARIPENAAFKRAVERRNAARRVQQASAAIALQRPTSAQPLLRSRGLRIFGDRLTRRVLFVGTAVFGTLATFALTLSVIHANNSVARPSAVTSSIQQSLPDEVFPWQIAARNAHSANRTAGITQAASASDASAAIPQEDSGLSGRTLEQDSSSPLDVSSAGSTPESASPAIPDPTQGSDELPSPPEAPSLESLPPDGSHPETQ